MGSNLRFFGLLIGVFVIGLLLKFVGWHPVSIIIFTFIFIILKRSTRNE